MSRYIFDIETDGIEGYTQVHCMVTKDIDTGERLSFVGQTEVREGLSLLGSADLVAGHHIIGYDLKVLADLYDFHIDPEKVLDTLVLSRLLYPNIGEWDVKLTQSFKLPGALFGSHSLEAWGYRLDFPKIGTDITDWSVYTPNMLARCENDTELNAKLLLRFHKYTEFPTAVRLEHESSFLCRQMEKNGFPFKVRDAAELYAKLAQQRSDIMEQMKTLFAPWYEKGKEVLPPKTLVYKDPMRADFTAGIPYTKVNYVTFNPSSRQHIANRLTTVRGWKPKEFTPSGLPKVDETTLTGLPFPEAGILATYFTLEKRIGQIAEGEQAWLKLERNGKIHGRINPNGTVTTRASHSNPNMGQVPSIRAPYGRECRQLFHVPAGWKQVGADLDALELRCLGHYMARYDDGAYIKVILEGNKDEGTDNHSVNARALGLDPKDMYQVDGQNQSGRDIAKTWFYAYIYGAGNEKLGMILGVPAGQKAARQGKASRENFERELYALGRLRQDVITVLRDRQYLTALDGRKLRSRSEHSSLNTLLQSAGALICKKWLLLTEQELLAQGLKHGWDGDFALMAWVHDEQQNATREGNEHVVGDATKSAAIRTGEFFAFRCPIIADYKVGTNWAECH